MRKAIILVILIVVIGALAVGCGSQQAQDSNVLKVGVEGTYPPFNFENKEGKLNGKEN